MARRRKGRPVHGWIILDKPSGLTSTDAVGRVKRMFNAAKAGHAGTLDPLANGILPIALGEATKTVPFVVDGSKGYRFTVRWGLETDTDDVEGTPTDTSDVRPSRLEIEEALSEFIGEIEQIPPRFSAIKVDGARAYDLAREGGEFELRARMVHVHRLEIAEVPDADHCVFEADCGKGTYVRALARDIGRRLGVFGHIKKLRRTRVGPFTETATISLDKLEELSHSAAGHEGLDAELLPVETALDDIPALAVSGDDAARLARGQAVLLRGRDAPVINGPVYATSRGHLVALGEVKRGELWPKRVFNLNG
ncbi:MAG: tRNA pseudouridine(55) synthase TruB [Hyphomicrobiaceae bacterium]|nr:tRNA pseudouridine(55) synthase TruB [Hyphomicrobiaceae bacterium]